MSLDSPRILSIGQCHIDGPRIKRVLRQHLGAVVEEADSASEAASKARHSRYDLILINRELDRDHSSGVDLVSELVAINSRTPVMIVSDFENAQQSAMQHGAVRGFGKSDLESIETLSQLRAAVASASPD
jgi:DNA-binding NarL/FixJ family response regulator